MKSIDDNIGDQSSVNSDSIGSPVLTIDLSSQTNRSITSTDILLQNTDLNLNTNQILTDDNENGNVTVDNNISCETSEISNTLMSDNLSSPLDLATFLIQRACKNSTLANYLYWYLSIECENQEAIRKQDERCREMYVTVLRTFSRTLSTGIYILFK